ncbi:MAG TPA: glycosyltransferase family 4 protein [Mucilaginibacter sp.]|jgi:glycosyltransferase involved in cell wall biosynthesis
MGLFDAGILSGFRTTVATFPGNVFDRMGALSLFSEFKRRQYNPVLEPLTKAWPWRELRRFAVTKSGLHRYIQNNKEFYNVDGVYQDLDKRVADSLKIANKNGTDAIYAYEDGALLSFIEAKRLGMKCLYDLPTGYWRTVRKIMDIERERRPEWESTLTGLDDTTAKLARKDEELRLADRIFVASSFVANTLKDYPGKLASVEIIPYGFPPVCSSREYAPIRQRPVKLLYVGKLSQMKGIAELFAAVDAFGTRVELTLVGRKVGQECAALEAALAKHRWIPSLPHPEILKIMREHDVLIFPSLLEGFGLVITEAMSQGTPVITTERTAGIDLINHSENGWIADAGSVDSLQMNIENILTKPDLIKETGRLAMEAANNRPWGVYEQELVQSILKIN